MKILAGSRVAHTLVRAASALLPTLASLHAAPTYKDVSAIFAARCYGCHAAAVKMGSLNLQTWDGFQEGGTHGKIVVPGKSAESRLYLLVAGKEMPTMPMDGSKLSPEQIETIRAWIDAGAIGGPTAAAPITTSLPKLDPKVHVKPQIFDLAYSPDGKILALAGYKEVRLVDSATKQELAKLAGPADTVRAVAFSKDGKLLAAAGGLPARSGEVLIFDVAQRKLLHTIHGHSDCIYGVAFSPDGRSVATASYDKFVKLFDIESEKEVRTYKDHIDAVYAVEFTPDGKRLVSGSADRSVKIWNVESGERLYTLSDPQDGINTLAIDPTGKLVAAAGLDKSIRIWALGEKEGKLLHSQIAHEDAILRLAWSPDGTELVSSSADHTVKVFSSKDLSELHSYTEPDWVYGLQFAPNGKTFAIGRFDGSLTITPQGTP
ncbi:MAG TPA: c-type cytochrome domain-containing protein [Bryobacteraceae bacterium]|nr:c-type cytochrome domain-containing protein [Bryobacteraceae bacterium]